MLDERWIRALHVEAMRRGDLHAGHEAHVLFQASTVGALLDGAFEGDLSFAELAEQGDLGLGTLNRLDGEMIAVDGEFLRADADGDLHPVPPEAMTPFAVVTRFAPSIEARLEGPLDQAGLLARLDALIPAAASACAIRIDGTFESVRARSVPAQRPPYRPLAEVVADQQHVFELGAVAGTMVGFRFPAYAEGIEIGGYHLHFADTARRRGGHVLDFRCPAATVALDPSNDLHVELPPAVDLADPDLAATTHAAVEAVEHGG